MAEAYSKFEIEEAMGAMWKVLKETATEEQLEKLKISHDCIMELDEFGPHGPVGCGLGKILGHAIGD